MVRRAKKPLNEAAVDCADEKFYANHPDDPELFDADGNWIPLHPSASKHTAYRTEWMDLYEECGGEIEYDGGKTDPFNPVKPCDEEDVLVLMEVLELAISGEREQLRPVSSREQYVNLDKRIYPDGYHPEFGRLIRLVARVAWKSGKQADLADHMLVWQARRIGDDMVVELDEESRAGFNSPGSERFEQRNLTGSDGWTPPLEFHVSTYGGDRFELSASLEGGEPLGAGSYEVWKKFWYQVTEMQRPAGGRYSLADRSVQRIERWFQEAFIRFEERKSESQRTVAKYEADIPNRDDFGVRYYEPDRFAPFKAHLMIVGTFLTQKDGRFLSDTVDRPVWRSKAAYQLYGNHRDDKPWLLRAEFRRSGKARWRRLNPRRVKAIREGSESSWLRYRIEVDFSRGALHPSLKKPLEIQLWLGVYRIKGEGGNSQHAIIGLDLIGTSKEPIVEDWVGDLSAHEIGHCLGLLNLPPAGQHDHDAWRDPGTAHCMFPGCVMSYKALRGGTHGFHYDGASGTGCLDYLRRRDFSRKAMEGLWDK